MKRAILVGGDAQFSFRFVNWSVGKVISHNAFNTDARKGGGNSGTSTHYLPRNSDITDQAHKLFAWEFRVRAEWKHEARNKVIRIELNCCY